MIKNKIQSWHKNLDPHFQEVTFSKKELFSFLFSHGEKVGDSHCLYFYNSFRVVLKLPKISPLFLFSRLAQSTWYPKTNPINNYLLNLVNPNVFKTELDIELEKLSIHSSLVRLVTELVTS